jgi:gliding motility-associated-like protein
MKKILYVSFMAFLFQSFRLEAQFVINNDASITSPECSDSTTTYQLTPNLNNQNGEIWYSTQISLTHRFDIQFEMFLGTKPYSVGADGICFVFQQQSTNAGSPGGGLGYGGITPSLAVEFDTYQNGWDPAFCHTAIEKNGDVNHTDGSGNNLAGPVQLSPSNPNLPDDAWHNMEIIWNPVTDSLSVYFDCSYRVGYMGDVINSIFGGNPNVYWGFTAGTGGSDNRQEVCIAHSYLNNLRDTAVCQGDSVKLTSSGGVSYTWGPAGGLNKDTGASVYAAPNNTTTYTVSIKNNCGLISKDSVTITVHPLPEITMGTPTSVLCNGGNNGSASVIVSNGTAPYTYLWTPSGQTNAIATGLTAGVYTVTINDINGCNNTTGIVIITQPTAITKSITSTDATCADNDGTISVSTGGGTSPYSYLWTPGGYTSSSLSGLSSGTYTLTITDANGCIDSIFYNVGINKTFSVTITGPDSVCKGQNTVLTASGALNYLWSNSSTSSSLTVNPINTTNYWVIATTGVCTDSIPYEVAVYKQLSVNKLVNDSICPGTPVILKVKVTGGKPAYTYLWNNGIGNTGPGPITVYPTASTTYSIAVTDACNYIAADSMKVKVFPIGLASFNANPDSITDGQTVTFNNTSQNSTSFYWSFGDGNSSTDGAPTHPYLTPGTYQVILTAYNSYGCIDSAIGDIYVAQKVIIPNVFTPNGDGKNDIFYFTIRGAQCFHCTIYNRWGTLVYQSNDINSGWDGKIQQTGELAADGTYYYLINYCDYKNVAQKLDGFVQLIRNK